MQLDFYSLNQLYFIFANKINGSTTIIITLMYMYMYMSEESSRFPQLDFDLESEIHTSIMMGFQFWVGVRY